MKRGSGFTLVELLGVIVVIGLIALVSVPTIMNNMKKTSEQEYQRFLTDLYILADNYVESNLDKYELEKPDDSAVISLYELFEAGLLNKKMVNPKTEKEVNLSDVIEVKVLNDNTKKYEYIEINND